MTKVYIMSFGINMTPKPPNPDMHGNPRSPGPQWNVIGGGRDAGHGKNIDIAPYQSSSRQPEKSVFNDYRPVLVKWQCHGWSSHLG